jgi:glycosyltransferase involved in cell wall biosynthesis
MRDRELLFVLPAGSDLVSGGNLYNQHLIAALGRRCDVRTLSVAEGLAAMSAGEPGRYFVDTLNLGDLLGCLERRHAHQRRILVVHLLPSMRPDIAPDDPSLAIERAALPCFDGFLTTSAYTSGLLRDAGLSQAIMTVPPAPPAGDRPARGCPPVVRGVMVGNLVAGKGVLPLLEALDARVAAGDRFELELVGRTDMEPGYAEACRRVIASPRLAGMVHARGEVPYAEIGGCYGAASLLVSASQMESFGMALQEARAWGLPILACDAGNVRNHFEHGENGYLYGAIPELAAGFLALVRDPARMQRLFARAQAMRLGSDYTWDDAALALLGALDQPAQGQSAQ